MAAPIKRLLVVGGKGMLGQMVLSLAPRGLETLGLDLPDIDITSPSSVAAAFEKFKPDAVVNSAAYTDVDGCEDKRDLAMKVNGEAVGVLARECAKRGAVLVHISTDYVFDGTSRTPYREDDPTGPRSVYGESKLAGEDALTTSGLKDYFILRTSWLYGPGGKNFVDTIARLARERESLKVVADQVGTPTYTVDLARAIYRCLGFWPSGGGHTMPPFGVYHYSNLGQTSWHGFASRIVEILRHKGEQLPCRSVLPIPSEEYPQKAFRPRYSVFSKEKFINATGTAIPEWEESLRDYLKA